MEQIIEIKGEMVSIIDRSVSSTVALPDWMARMEKRMPIIMPTLPTGTRAVWWDPTDLTNQKLAVMIELTPQIINLTISRERDIVHRISIPYTRFVFLCTTDDPDNTLQWQIADYRVYWARNRYNVPAERDMVAALIPNVYEDGRICFGSTAPNARQTLANRLDQTVNEFYVSNFNNDLTIRYPNGWRDWAPWEVMTLTDPNGYTTWPDFNPDTSIHAITSWNEITERFRLSTDIRNGEPVAAADPIPPLQIGATFGRVEEWIGNLDNNGRARLRTALNDQFTTTPAIFEPVIPR